MYDLNDGEVITSTTDKMPKFKKWAMIAIDLTKWANVEGTCVKRKIAPMKLSSTTNP